MKTILPLLIDQLVWLYGEKGKQTRLAPTRVIMDTVDHPVSAVRVPPPNACVPLFLIFSH
jgi:hypothetical protein